MTPEYKFSIGQRVTDGRRTGEVTFSTHNGRGVHHYFVRWEDGSEGCHHESELQAS